MRHWPFSWEIRKGPMPTPLADLSEQYECRFVSKVMDEHEDRVWFIEIMGSKDELMLAALTINVPYLTRDTYE